MPSDIALSTPDIHRSERDIVGLFEALVNETFRDRPQEWVIIAGMDRRGAMLHWTELSGSASRVLFDTDLLTIPLSDPAICYILIAHNHPSGNPHPSRADIVTTRSLADFCNEAGVKLVDHIIVGRTENHHIFRGIAA